MFLDKAGRSEILEKATLDLLDFLGHSVGSGEFNIWEDANREVRSINSKFPECKTLVEFVHEIFRWLDANTLVAVREMPENQKIRESLMTLRRWLESFASADEDLPEFYGTSRIMDFGHFIADRLGRRLHWTNASSKKSLNGKPTGLKGFPKDDFVSWMIVMDTANIHIIYDEKRMRGEDRERPTFLMQQIFERVLLHELGHARLQLSYFELFMPGQTSRPIDETEAWLYALFIRSLAVATRARLDRYLGQSDTAYPL